jgi:hypothetical protein
LTVRPGGEGGAGAHRPAAGPLEDRTEDGGDAARDEHRGQEEQRRHSRAGDRRHADDDADGDDLVDDVVGEEDHALGVTGLGHHLGRRVVANPARPSLTVHQPQADAQRLARPPLGVPAGGQVLAGGVQRVRQDDGHRRPHQAAGAVDEIRPQVRQHDAVRADEDHHHEDGDRGDAEPGVVEHQPDDLAHRPDGGRRRQRRWFRLLRRRWRGRCGRHGRRGSVPSGHCRRTGCVTGRRESIGLDRLAGLPQGREPPGGAQGTGLHDGAVGEHHDLIAALH